MGSLPSIFPSRKLSAGPAPVAGSQSANAFPPPSIFGQPILSSCGGAIVVASKSVAISQQIQVRGSISGEQRSVEFTVSADGESVLTSNLQGAFPSSSTSGQFVLVNANSMISSGNSQSYSSLSFSSLTSAIPGLWLDSSKRRSRSQIYVEILELMKRGPMTPFEIAFYARLNHKRTKAYVEFLERSGYLDVASEDGKVEYFLTKNGVAFLEGVRSLFEELESAEFVSFDRFQR
jgi:predicted transcriptional regulator